MLADIELLVGDHRAAELLLRDLCEGLDRAKAHDELASRASDLAEALLGQGQDVESEEWTVVAERNAAEDDVHAQMMWRSVRAKVLARLAAPTDGLNAHAKGEGALGEVLQAAGRASEAAGAFARAAALYERKGNVVGAARMREELAQARADPRPG